MGPELNPVQAGVPPARAESASRPRYRWYQKLAALVYVFFCFELGAFLLLTPWMELWERNYFGSLFPLVWFNPYLRGAVSGLGLINIGISISELFRLRRFSKH